jgi:hypothetical protein
VLDLDKNSEDLATLNKGGASKRVNAALSSIDVIHRELVIGNTMDLFPIRTPAVHTVPNKELPRQKPIPLKNIMGPKTNETLLLNNFMTNFMEASDIENRSRKRKDSESIVRV